jgi:S-adenosylmethionine:tRNA ribosyltransferase-isomerase
MAAPSIRIEQHRAPALAAARWPREDRQAERLLYVDSSTDSFRDHRVSELAALLEPGDVVVVNDAATLPASFSARDQELELRLMQRLDTDTSWRALLFGSGDWRTPTEARPLPPSLAPGDRLELGDALVARLVRVDADQPRLVEIELEPRGMSSWSALYRHGRPVQYAYLDRPLELWHVQNAFAARPWALELPSAGRPIGFETLAALRARGVEVARLTHAAGISSTGSEELDRRLPFDERYEIEERTCELVAAARARNARVVAVGTTVVRALESSAAAHGGQIVPGTGIAKLVIGPGYRSRVVDGLFTGLHEPGTSHFMLLRAFARVPLLERALEHAASSGYLQHEFGDSMLVL